jgi:hypothetical protein
MTTALSQVNISDLRHSVASTVYGLFSEESWKENVIQLELQENGEKATYVKKDKVNKTPPCVRLIEPQCAT